LRDAVTADCQVADLRDMPVASIQDVAGEIIQPGDYFVWLQL
jgi:hypothetical protein